MDLFDQGSFTGAWNKVKNLRNGIAHRLTAVTNDDTLWMFKARDQDNPAMFTTSTDLDDALREVLWLNDCVVMLQVKLGQKPYFHPTLEPIYSSLYLPFRTVEEYKKAPKDTYIFGALKSTMTDLDHAAMLRAFSKATGLGIELLPAIP